MNYGVLHQLPATSGHIKSKQQTFTLNTNRPSDIPNFILIKHKRAEIQGREVNRELWRKNGYYVTVYVDLWPSAVSNHLAKTASKSVHLFGWRSAGHTHTDKLQWKYNPSTILWRCNKQVFLFQNDVQFQMPCEQHLLK